MDGTVEPTRQWQRVCDKLFGCILLDNISQISNEGQLKLLRQSSRCRKGERAVGTAYDGLTILLAQHIRGHFTHFPILIVEKQIQYHHDHPLQLAQQRMVSGVERDVVHAICIPLKEGESMVLNLFRDYVYLPARTLQIFAEIAHARGEGGGKHIAEYQ